eukprot:CAMPEP_0114987702 /NCGR_PEP_ID=MMETSP0216-20121206/9164_1 /TAXON_ID=223996 /ORGANISM="Protocruzia adherens, Strain Boccale" /LENGTH=325 /DNA_ID=CAMNT_0002350349 /DNA_START=140 /DNA_END=1117 /DNA_ORIENTATION=-
MIMVKCFKHMDKMAAIPMDVQRKYSAFIREDITKWSKCKFFVGGLIFMPARLILVVTSILTYYLIIRIMLIGSDRFKPYGPIRRTLLKMMNMLIGRILLLYVGIFWIKIKDFRLTDAKTKKKEFAPVLLSNHLSIVDILVLMAMEGPSFVSKEELYHVPVVGASAAAMQSVFVKRSDAESRGSALDTIIDRKREVLEAQGKGFPRIAIFPEGTTTCGKEMIPFKKGGLLGNFPVQPVTLKYSSPWVDFPYAIINEGIHAVMLCCQPYACLEVSYLEMYECNEENWEVDAEKLRKIMADYLGQGLSKLTFRDQQDFSRSVWTKNKA